MIVRTRKTRAKMGSTPNPKRKDNSRDINPISQGPNNPPRPAMEKKTPVVLNPTIPRSPTKRATVVGKSGAINRPDKGNNTWACTKIRGRQTITNTARTWMIMVLNKPSLSTYRLLRNLPTVSMMKNRER
jgi:hypothetical protein